MDSIYSRDNKKKVAVSVKLDNKFYNDCFIIVNLITPLVSLLCIVDCDERPSMRYVYEACIELVWGLRNYLKITKDYTSLIHKSYSNVGINNCVKIFMHRLIC